MEWNSSKSREESIRNQEKSKKTGDSEEGREKSIFLATLFKQQTNECTNSNHLCLRLSGSLHADASPDTAAVQDKSERVNRGSERKRRRGSSRETNMQTSKQASSLSLTRLCSLTCSRSQTLPAYLLLSSSSSLILSPSCTHALIKHMHRHRLAVELLAHYLLLMQDQSESSSRSASASDDRCFMMKLRMASDAR